MTNFLIKKRISHRKSSEWFSNVYCKQSKFYLVFDSYPRTGCLDDLSTGLGGMQCDPIGVHPFRGNRANKKSELYFDDYLISFEWFSAGHWLHGIKILRSIFSIFLTLWACSCMFAPNSNGTSMHGNSAVFAWLYIPNATGARN